MIDCEERLAVIGLGIMKKADAAMDAELASAKNKSGIFKKYISMIPPFALSDSPWSFEGPDHTRPIWNESIAIGINMKQRLDSFATANGIA